MAALLSRTSDPQQWARWEELATQTGYCTNPVRLLGGIAHIEPATGEILHRYETAGEPDGVLLLPCRNRRASVCPTCSATYAADTWQLVSAGLRGGKGLPASVAEHPRVFATLTAPSFGPVHTAYRFARACQTDGPMTCRHGVSRMCPTVHDTDSQVVGAPLCPACFDYPALVLFNAYAPQLWVRTMIETRRRLAALTGSSVRQVQTSVRVSYTKIAEYQRRGAIHVHAVIRLDARTDSGVRPPSPPYNDPGLLAAAVGLACQRVSMTPPDPADDGNAGRPISWGTQADISVIIAGSARDGADCAGKSDRAIANYVAKYVTKGLLDPRRSGGATDADTSRSHLARIADTCRELSQRPELADLNLARRVEGLGYPSRPTSRSRSYSTTMGALRQERSRHAAARTGPPTAVTAPEAVIIDADWRYAGRGWRCNGEAGYIAHRAGQRLAAIDHAAQERAGERRQATGADHD